jgi:deoxyguanosine kinase
MPHPADPLAGAPKGADPAQSRSDGRIPAMAIPSEGDVPLRHVAIDGPIGVGKTSLVELMARRFHGTKILEDVDNPFLPDFYKRKKGSAFQTQLFFLLSRYQQQRDLAQIDLFTTLVVADYHFPKDKIFACLNLDDSELMIYDRLYTLLSETVPRPDLVIYLQGSLETCMKRIKKASRSIEKGITPEYVAQLIEAYNYYFYHYEETPLLVVDTNEIDFVNRPADFDDLVAQVQKAKKGVQYYVPAAHS